MMKWLAFVTLGCVVGCWTRGSAGSTTAANSAATPGGDAGLVAQAMAGPFATLDAWCAPRAAAARAEGRELACGAIAGGAFLSQGRYDGAGWCAGREDERCPEYDARTPVANARASARAQLVSVSDDGYAECFLGVQTQAGWYVANAGQACRQVGVANGWLEIEALEWFDDNTIVLRAAERRRHVESWGMWFCDTYPEARRTAAMTVCRVGGVSTPSCVSIPTEQQREPLAELAPAAECEPDADAAAAPFAPARWQSRVTLVDAASVQVDPVSSSGSAESPPPAPGRHPLAFAK